MTPVSFLEEQNAVNSIDNDSHKDTSESQKECEDDTGHNLQT